MSTRIIPNDPNTTYVLDWIVDDFRLCISVPMSENHREIFDTQILYTDEGKYLINAIGNLPNKRLGFEENSHAITQFWEITLLDLFAPG